MPVKQRNLFDEPLQVSQITAEIRELLSQAYQQVAVVGEVTNLNIASSGHYYFSIKDATASLKCLLWGSKAERLKFKVTNGLKVVIRGKIDVWPVKGEYSLHTEEITPHGMGQLELAFRQLYEKVEARGWFSEARKRSLPPFPKRLGLVTSLSGAALRDMLKVLQERWPLTEVWVIPVPVQGDQAGEHIAETLRWLNQLSPTADLLILSRGGGSMEDLWAFNEEVVAHAIFHSRIPIITGIGHETDTTIADLVADYRAPTPTAAATKAVPLRSEWLDRLRGAYVRLKQLTIDNLTWEWERLERLRHHRLIANPTQFIDDHRQEVDDLGDRLQRATQQRLQHAQRDLARQAAVLAALSPLQVLGRGYSVTKLVKNGQPLLHSSEADVGDEVESILHDGRIRSRVESVS